MPCDSRIPKGMSLEQRNKQITEKLRLLEANLSAGKVKITIGTNGALAFNGWNGDDRSEITDVCAYRALSAENSWALRQAISRAEAQSGRKMNPQAIGAGVHSHDGGKTWHPGH